MANCESINRDIDLKSDLFPVGSELTRDELTATPDKSLSLVAPTNLHLMD